MYEASRQGDQEVVQWLDGCCKYERHKAMEYAASTGRLEVVMWLYEQEKQDAENAKDTEQVKDVTVYMVQPLETKLRVLNWVAVFPKKKCFREVFASRTGLLADAYDQRDPLLPWEDAEALVKYCPESSLKLDWMPLWAAQRGDLFVMKQLYSVKHPQLFTQQVFTAIMRYSKAGDLLQWFQTHSPILMGDSAVVEWGVKYRQFAYLSYVFLKFQPARTEERFRQHGVEYALQIACSMGHLDVVTWICGNCEIFLNVPAAELHAKLGRLSIWNDALIAAARCGQVGILTWLHEKFTFFRKVPESSRKLKLVGKMGNAAAGYGQLGVLRWLHANVAPQLVPNEPDTVSAASSDASVATVVETSFVSTEGLLEAMVHRHVDVVQWVCAVDIHLVSEQTSKRRGELATFLREEADGFIPSKLGFVFPPQ
ncbi:hypothetical protein PHMEG_0004007 [Phytophthora megakarya]|uniref:Ankyrin repeat-containing domain n=1 Tax=Phytophthora megakarya TaxID=4795 RepID=A0A225WWH2_9STRA|nr:hypothetical protein PHMEG_0004007 [Phytophthora megakarya]